MSTSPAAQLPELPDDDRTLSVLVVDDHEVVQWGFRLKLSRERWIRRCICAMDAEQALALARRFEPHVALVDLMLGDEAGADVCEQIRELSPGTRTILMSGAGSITPGVARSVGACGFVSKGWPTADILHTVHAVGLGCTMFPATQELTGIMLTSREHEMLELLAAGATNQDIAQQIFLSPHTVKGHVTSLYRKLGVKNRAGAVQRAHRMGLLA